jgi:mRNA interferase RelE/StbE
LVWRIEYADSVVKQLKKLDKPVARQILDYLDNNVAPLQDPKTLGKALTGQLGDFWRYRVGDLRVICHIENEAVTVLVLRVSHRSSIYDDQKQVASKAQAEIEAFRESERPQETAKTRSDRTFDD